MNKDRDLHEKTGRDRLGRNLLSLWAVEIVVIISGFVTPRLIDEQLGQVQLGVWDLGWSIVSYFRFLGMGMTGGLNRYVALYQASGDFVKLGRILSSTVALQALWTVLTLLFSFGAAWFVPAIVDPEYADVVEPVRWVVIFLGGTLAARTFGSSARGLLTGYHLWTWNSAVQISGDVLSLIVMVIVLLLGGSLAEVAGSYFAVTLGTESLRWLYARRRYGRRLYDRSEVAFDEIRELFIYSLKTNAGVLPQIIVIQTVNIVLASVAGPAALAVYARSLALQRHASVVIASFTKLLTPTIGSLQGLGRDDAYKPFFLQSLRMSLALSLPLYIVLAAHGDLLLKIWMGENYIASGLLMLVCAGMLLPTVGTGPFRILAGLNEHGKAGMIAFAVTAVVLGLSLLVMNLNGFEWTTQAAAIVLGLCLTFGSAVPIFVMACVRFSVSWRELWTDGVWRPVAANLPLVAVLAAGSRWIDRYSLLDVFGLLVVAGVVAAVSNWFLLLTRGEKRRIRARIAKRSGNAQGEAS